ncbi:MAG TPA: hypothetical protein VMD52_06780 [Patescibacteria group bacterium]|nr:hypothetical protein [Patescibacteria group bacterium]
MRKILLALCVVAFCSSFCFAQQPPATNIYQRFTGKVESIVLGSVEKRVVTRITVVSLQGKTITFGAKLNTVITTKDGTKLTHEGLKKGDIVAVYYEIRPKGLNLAKTIAVMNR